MGIGDGDGGVPHGALLIGLVEAALTGTAGELTRVRRKVRQALGPAALVDAAATIASFNAVVKLADGTGIPLEPAKAERTVDIRQALAIDEFRR
jgi:hypothetical protein